MRNCKIPIEMEMPGDMKVVEWSEEDKCFIGSAPTVIGPCCRGDDEIEVDRQLDVILEEWREICLHGGKSSPEVPKEGVRREIPIALRYGPAGDVVPAVEWPDPRGRMTVRRAV